MTAACLITLAVGSVACNCCRLSSAQVEKVHGRCLLGRAHLAHIRLILRLLIARLSRSDIADAIAQIARGWRALTLRVARLIMKPVHLMTGLSSGQRPLQSPLCLVPSVLGFKSPQP